MESLELLAETRQELGSRASRRLRRLGRVPGSLYGHGGEVKSVHVDRRVFEAALRHHVRVVNLKIDGAAETAVVQGVEHDPISQNVTHIDFLRVDVTQKVEVAVSLKLHGPAKGTKEGGVLQEQNDQVLVRCLPLEIPEEIEVDIRELKVGDTVHARDVELPDGLELADDPEKVLLSIAEPRYGVTEVPTTAEAEGEPAEPEVIGKTEKAEDSESES